MPASTPHQAPGARRPRGCRLRASVRPQRWRWWVSAVRVWPPPCIAGGERRNDLAREDRQREVPWRDAGKHTATVELQSIGLAGRPGKYLALSRTDVHTRHRSSGRSPRPPAPPPPHRSGSCPPPWPTSATNRARLASNRSARRSRHARRPAAGCPFPTGEGCPRTVNLGIDRGVLHYRPTHRHAPTPTAAASPLPAGRLDRGLRNSRGRRRRARQVAGCGDAGPHRSPPPP